MKEEVGECFVAAAELRAIAVKTTMSKLDIIFLDIIGIPESFDSLFSQINFSLGHGAVEKSILQKGQH